MKKTILNTESNEHMAKTNRSEYHVQRHWDVEIKGIVVAHANHEKHRDQYVIRAEWDSNCCSATFRSEYESLQCDEKKL